MDGKVGGGDARHPAPEKYSIRYLRREETEALNAMRDELRAGAKQEAEDQHKEVEARLVWHDRTFSYKSLSDGRLPIQRGGYSYAPKDEPALYVDLDGATLESDLKMHPSDRIATLYNGEHSIQRISIVNCALSEDKRSISIAFIRFPTGDPYAKSERRLGPVEEEVWDEAYFKFHRVFLGIWM